MGDAESEKHVGFQPEYEDDSDGDDGRKAVEVPSIFQCFFLLTQTDYDVPTGYVRTWQSLPPQKLPCILRD